MSIRRGNFVTRGSFWGGVICGFAIVAVAAWVLHRPGVDQAANPCSSVALRVLGPSEMARVRGGWLEPKARKPRSACTTCQTCEMTSGCSSSPTGGSPTLDATTAEVTDKVGALSVGGPAGGLSLALTYGSHLADGTNSVLATTLGDGWTHTYGDYLLVRGSDYIWVRGDGEIVRFTRRGAVFRTSTGQFCDFDVTGPTSAEAREADGTVYAFAAASVAWPAPGPVYVLTQITDRNGRATTISYAGGLLSTVVGPYSQQISFEYDGQNRLVRTTAAGREVRYEYTAPTGQVSAVVLPDATRVQYTYDYLGQLVTKTDASNNTYTVEYDAQNRASRLYDPLGAVIAEQSSSTGWQPDHAASLGTGEMHYVPGTSMLTDGRGNMWMYDYDARGRITQRVDPLGNVATYEYDPTTLLVTRITDENGYITEYEYDAQGNRTLMRDAEGNVTTYTYEPVYSHVTQTTEPDGDVWTYIYDSMGNLVQEIDPLHETPVDATTTYTYYSDGLLQTRTDRNGNTTTYTYDAAGNLMQTVDPAGAETDYTYDAFGNRLSRTLHNTSGDQTTAYTYDALNRLVTTTDAIGTTAKSDYDAAGNRIRTYTDWVDDGNYRTRTDYQYDARNRLIGTIEDVGGLNRTTLSQYDGNNNRIAETNPRGIVTQYTYDPLNRLTQVVIDPGGLALMTQVQYDPVGNSTARTDANGNTTLYVYDALRRVTLTTDALGYITELHYSPPGAGGGCACGTPGSSTVTCQIDAAGKVTRYEYDALDRRILEIRQVGPQGCSLDPDGDDAIAVSTYDPVGNLLTRTDPNGNVTSWSYTARNEVASVTNGAGETIAHTYDAAGNRTHVLPPNGNDILTTYDAANRIVETSDALGVGVTYTYDALGNRISETDALGHTISSAYDHLDRLVTRTDPLGNTTSYQYDAVGNLTRVVDREGNRTEATYDAADRRIVTQVWPDAMGAPATTTFTYDAAGHLATVTDANGHVTQYTYDAANRRVAETYADGTVVRFTYDGVGNLVTREDHMGDGGLPGNISTYEYDDLHRLVEREYANGEYDSFTYDIGGRMLTADNNYTHVEFAYDSADRVASTTQADLPATYGYTLAYVYDVYANTRTVTYPSGQVVVEARDLRDRLDSVSDAATYTYDAADRRVTKSLANGTTAQYVYDADGRVTELRHLAPGGVSTIAGFAYTYDREDNRLSAQNLQDVLPVDPARPATLSEVYQFDDTYRLRDYRRGPWAGGGIPSPRRHRTWALDPLDNWTGFGIFDSDSGESADYCNAVNQMNEYDDASTDGPCPVPDDDGLPDDFGVSPCLLKHGGAAATMGGKTLPAPRASRAARRGGTPATLVPRTTGANFKHDKNGNLVSDGVHEFYYDYQDTGGSCLRSKDRLTMVQDAAGSTVFAEYTYDALGRRVSRSAGGGTTIFVYDNWREVEEYVDGVLARSYTYGTGPDELLTVDRAAEADRLYYHGAALDNIIAVSDESGTVLERYVYDPYGGTTFCDAAGAPQAQSLIGNSRLFAGRYLDAATGLYYFRARDLYPLTGRFLERDPLGYVDGMNLYQYVQSNPVGRTDPLGLNTWYVRTGVDWSIKGYYWWSGWDPSPVYVGFTRNFAKIDTDDCCKLSFNRSLDNSRSAWKGHVRGRFWDVWHRFNTQAVGDTSSKACVCQRGRAAGRRVDGIEINVYHVYATDEDVTITLGASAGAEAGNDNAKVSANLSVNVTIPPSKYKSKVLWTYLVCPTGDAADPPTVTDKGAASDGIANVSSDLQHFYEVWRADPSVHRSTN